MRIWFRLCENGRRKCRSHSVNVGIMRATGVAIDEIRALASGPGDLGEGHKELIAECVPLLRRAGMYREFLPGGNHWDSVSEVSIFLRRQCPVWSGASETDVFISPVTQTRHWCYFRQAFPVLPAMIVLLRLCCRSLTQRHNDSIVRAIGFVIGGRRALLCKYVEEGEGLAPTSAFNRRQRSCSARVSTRLSLT